MSKKRIFFLMLGALSMAACVSKRKYLELETAKFQADEQIKNLTNDNETLNLRIANLTSGFEQMKQELMASNARKDQLINELNGQILRLTTNVRDKETSLEKNQFTYSFEKRQMEAEVAKSKQEAAELAAKYKALQTELTEVKTQTSNLQFELTRQTEAAQRADERIQQQTNQLTTLKAEVNRLTASMREKDETIERLTNNVALLKKQLGN